MKVIDLLNKIANGEVVPKKIKVNDLSIPPSYRELTFDDDLQLYIHNDEQEFTSVLDNYHLNYEVENIEDKPKEDKKIEKVNRGCIAGETLRNIDWHILDKLDEIIDKVNKL